MTPIGKDITKRNEIACSSTSYTLFVFYGFMFTMVVLTFIVSFKGIWGLSQKYVMSTMIMKQGKESFLKKDGEL